MKTGQTNWGLALATRYESAEKSENYSKAHATLTAELIKYANLDWRSLGGWTKIFEKEVNKATSGMEEDCGMWGRGNLIRQLLLWKSMEFRNNLVASKGGRK